MTRLISSLPFSYFFAFLFTILAFYLSDKLSVQIITWGIYVIFNIYLFTIERIPLCIPAFFSVIIFITGGIYSPLMPLLFLLLPFVLSFYEKHYFYYVALSFLTLLLTGSIENPVNFLIYIVFIIAAAIVYINYRKDLFSHIFKPEIELNEKVKDDFQPSSAVDDPFMSLKIYLNRLRIWDKNIPVAIRIVEVHEENGTLFGEKYVFPLTGLVRLAVKNSQDIACSTIPEEKNVLPMMPEFNRRIYFPINLYDYHNKNIDPEYVIIIDASFNGDKHLLIEKFSPIKKDIIELIKLGETFNHIYVERKRKEKLYHGARHILDSFKRDSLFQASAWSVFNILPDTSAVLITELKKDTHFGHIYKLDPDNNEIITMNSIIPTCTDEVRDQQSIQHMMISKKIGKSIEVRDLSKRKDNLLFTQEKFQELNHYDKMYSFLLQYNKIPKGTINVFVNDEIEIPSYLKTDLSLLTQIFTSALNNIEMFEKVEELSNVDVLTSLYNRRYFQENLDRMAMEAARSDMSLSLMIFDVDFFKKVNDTYGHKAGDDVIKFMAKTLKSNIRKVDIAARYGGEEFVLLLHNTSREGAYGLAEKIRKIIDSTTVKTEDANIKITTSVGLSSYPDLSKTPDDLIKHADDALYFSKEHGRNQVTAYSKVMLQDD